MKADIREGGHGDEHRRNEGRGVELRAMSSCGDHVGRRLSGRVRKGFWKRWWIEKRLARRSLKFVCPDRRGWDDEEERRRGEKEVRWRQLPSSAAPLHRPEGARLTL
jgi:hypothetical protein